MRFFGSLNQDLQDLQDEQDDVSLIQSALGEHRDWESAPTRKPVNIVLGRARLPEKRFPR